VAADFWRTRFQTRFLKEKYYFLAIFETNEFKNSSVEARFVFFVIDLSVIAFIFARRVFWAVDAAGRTLGAAGTRTAAVLTSDEFQRIFFKLPA
jgi:hypothetical protein